MQCAFLKIFLRNLFCNHNTDCNKITHVAAMACNISLYSSPGEDLFYLMFGHDTFMPASFKLLLPKLRYYG